MSVDGVVGEVQREGEAVITVYVCPGVLVQVSANGHVVSEGIALGTERKSDGGDHSHQDGEGYQKQEAQFFMRKRSSRLQEIIDE